jgi:hypothetical protein
LTLTISIFATLSWRRSNCHQLNKVVANEKTKTSTSQGAQRLSAFSFKSRVSQVKGSCR